MPRSLNATFLTAVLARQSGTFPVVLVTVTHADFATTYRFNSDNSNFIYGGNTYLGVSLGIGALSDDDRPPRGVIQMVNVNQVVGVEMLGISTPASVSLVVVSSANFAAPDASNNRTEIGTAPILYQATNLLLRNVRGDAMFVEGDIEAIDVTSQPWPAVSATQARLPGLFR
jgi:hypothetical protein